MAPTQPGPLTDTEVRLAERYVRVLDFVSRCAQAIDHGDCCYLREKARQLEDAAGRLATVADQTWQQRSAGTPRPRTQAIRAAVAHAGRHDRAAQLLHPAAPDANGGCGAVSEPLDVRVIGAPEAAAQAVARLGGLLELDRQHGPHPSRTTPGLVRSYLTGRLRPSGATATPPQAPRDTPKGRAR
jgi:hypothetical protein